MVVVDDDPAVRTLLELLLTLDERFALAGTASSGEQCLELLRGRDADDIDVLVMDVTLRDMDGIELVHHVRELNRDIAVALFSGWDDEETQRRARVANVDSFVRKDCDPHKLLDSLANVARRPSEWH